MGTHARSPRRWRALATLLVLGVPACTGNGFWTGWEPPPSHDAICFVTNTADSGAGSLRECVEQSSDANQTRFVIFRVGGTIELKSSLDLDEEHGGVYIAGQSAPGGGITITGAQRPRRDALCESLITIDGADDVVIRYVRFRGVANSSCGTVNDMDAIEIRNGATNVVIDHNSFTWGIDDVVGFWTDASHGPNRDITLSYNIIAEGLDDSIHGEGPHSMGIHLSGRVPSTCYENPAHRCTEGGTSDVTLHHNLVISSAQRMPELNGPNDGVIDLRNNVIYNWRGEQPLELSSKHCGAHINVVRNVFKRGPSSDSSGAIVAYEDSEGADDRQCDTANGRHDDNMGVYFDDNVIPSGWAMTSPAFDACDGGSCETTSEWDAPAVPTTPAAVAFADVLARAGVRKPLYDAGGGWGHALHGWNYASDLDDVDRRLVDEAVSCTSGSGPGCVGALGSIKDEPPGSGTAPSAGTAYTDADSDGMYDLWESNVCAASKEQCAPHAHDLSLKHSNIEMFLQDLVDAYDVPA